MTVLEPVDTEARDRLVAEILHRFPPVSRLEDLMGPEPPDDEVGEVDTFLRARAAWRRPYGPPGATR